MKSLICVLIEDITEQLSLTGRKTKMVDRSIDQRRDAPSGRRRSVPDVLEIRPHFRRWNRTSVHPFLPRDTMLSAIYAVVVCLCACVCVSVTLQYCIKTAKRRITQIIPHDSPETLVFWHQSSRRNSNGITPYEGDKCRWGGL